MGTMREIANEDAQDSNHSQERSHIREIATRAPIGYLCDMALVGNASTRRASMTYDAKLLRAKDRLEAGERASCVLHALYDAIDVLHVLPYKTTDAGVFGYHLEGAIWSPIIGGRCLDRDVIDKS